jgi:hypothetical protein
VRFAAVKFLFRHSENLCLWTPHRFLSQLANT